LDERNDSHGPLSTAFADAGTKNHHLIEQSKNKWEFLITIYAFGSTMPHVD
jgi:hypothetical protein